MAKRRALFITAFFFMFGLSSAFAQDIGVTPTEVLIGSVNPLTGTVARSGRSTDTGARLYFDHINKQGGIHGRKIRLLTEDDEYKPEKSAAAARKLVNDDKVFALFNCTGTPTVRAAMPIAVQAGTPFLFGRTGDSTPRSPFNRLVFNFRASYQDDMEAVVEVLVGKLKKKRIAIIVQDDGLGNGLRAAAALALSKRDGMKLIAEAKIERNSTDVAKMFQTIEEANPDAVILGSTSAAGAPFMEMARQKKKDWVFGGTSANNGVVTQDTSGLNILLAQPVPHPKLSKLPIVVQYREMAAAAKVDPKLDDYGVLEGFITAAVTVDALKRAGKNLNRNSFIKALESEMDIGGIKVVYSATDHNGKPPVFMTKVEKSEIVEY